VVHVLLTVDIVAVVIAVVVGMAAVTEFVGLVVVGATTSRPPVFR
jgi:hypothetical protein